MAPKKDKQKETSPPTLPQIGRAALDKLQLARRYYSGELENDRMTSRILGSLPWRILRYERVLEPEQIILPVPRASLVTPKTFRKHIRALKRDCEIISLEELVNLLANNEPVPERSVVITFDGGWMDTFLNAYPIIQEETVPVTVFLPTAFIGSNHLFWPDRVALALLEMKRSDKTIEPFEFFTQEIKDAFQVVCPDGTVSIQAIFLMIEGLRRAKPEHRALAIGFLGEIFNALGGQMPLNPFFMQWNEVELMETLGVQFGSMGHHHISYRELEPEQAYDDMNISLTVLREHLKRPLLIAAAPLGDFDGRVVDSLSTLGIHSCLLEDTVDDMFAYAEPLRLLRRICPEEATTFSTELFFCKIWDLATQDIL